MLYCPDVNSNLAPLGKVYLITENKGPGYTAFHSMPHIYMKRFLATLFRSGQLAVKKGQLFYEGLPLYLKLPEHEQKFKIL